MKTPYTILIGLALIAAALFFRQPSIAPAQAGGFKVKYMDGFKCVSAHAGYSCFILHEDKVIAVTINPQGKWEGPKYVKWTLKRF